MRTHIVFLSLAAVCLTLNPPALATDRLVPGQYPTIQAAIDDCNNGDTVIVAEGTYTGTGNRDIDFKGKAITVRSIDPEDPCVVAATVIDCQGSSGDYHRGFHFHNGETYSSVMAGLKIINGYEYIGGGILCSGSSPTIAHCVITGNSTWGKGGGGIISMGVESNPKISYCAIMGNSSNSYGGGMRSEEGSNPTISNCTITGNKIKRGDRGGGGLFFNSSRPIIRNCTVSANRGGNRGGGMYCYMGVNATIINSIFWDNEATGGAEFYLYHDNELSVSYCDIEGGWEGERNIDADPCFVAPGHWDANGLWIQGNYHLSFVSPCINAGDPIHSPAPGETDIDGDPRVINNRIDMGVDEFNGEGPVIEVWPLEFEFFAIEEGTNPESRILSIRNNGLDTLNWEIIENCSWLEAIPDRGSSMGEVIDVRISVDNSDLKADFYNCVLTVSGVDILGIKPTISVNFWISEKVVYVPKQYPTIQQAIDEVAEGVVVIVEPGTYTGAGNKNLDFGGKAITVRSIDPEDPNVVTATVIDCENSGRGFYFHRGEEANSVLTGLTIQRGRVTGRPAKGGAIYCSDASPTIKNCVITSNSALGYQYGDPHGGSAHGGGVYCVSNSNPLIIDCTISNNHARGGDGADAYCSPHDVQVAGRGGSAYGGGIYCDSTSNPVIQGCSVINNRASGGTGGDDDLCGIGEGNGGWACGGGVYCGSASTVINNCSIVSNTAIGGDGGQGGPSDAGGGIGLGGGLYGELEVSNCTIRVNEALKGSGFGVDPMLVFSGGDGICCTGSSSIHNCLIVNNNMPELGGGFINIRGSAIYIRSGGSCQISNCTVLENTSDDLETSAIQGNAEITNSIIWGHGGRDVGGCSVTYSCTEQNVSGTGNIQDNPRFVTGPEGYYYLSQTAAGQAVDSPCVDAGSDLAVNLGMDIFTTRTDELKDTSIADMGFHYSVSPVSPDIDGDGDVDFFDYAWFATVWPYSTSHQIPRGSVVVDGDLGDWPEDVEWRRLDKVYWGNPNDVSKARFALQWDGVTDKVYAAVVVNDTDHVFTDEYVSWDASDRIEVYSQGDAEGGTGWYGIYDAAQQYYVAPDTIGGSWATWALGGTPGTDVGLEYAVNVNGAQIIYEVGVRQFDNYGGLSGGETVLTDLYAGHVVDFDVVACTRWDTVNFGMLSENLMTGKHKDAGKFAKYLLVDEIFSVDLDGNGVVNYADLEILFENWPGCHVTKATIPMPTNNAIDVDPGVMLSWWPGEGVLWHDVYLGTDADAVANAGQLSPEFMGTVSEAHFDPCGLDLGITYYWRIDEVGSACMVQGDVWRFKTYEPFRDLNLAGQWKFDEGTGSIAHDSVGDNDGTIYGATWTSGKFNGALSFDGSGDYVDCGNDASLDPGSGPFAVSVWIKTNVTNAHDIMIVGNSCGGCGGDLRSVWISTDGNHHVYVMIINEIGINSAGVFGTTNIEDGKWHYIVTVRDDNILYLYVDGVCEGTPADAASVGDVVGPAPWTIGALKFPDSPTVGFFNGLIDEVAIYK